MKTYPNAKALLSAWAGGEAPEGKAKSAALSFKGPFLLSYATPIAQLLPPSEGGGVQVITTKHSVTTSKHCGMVRRLFPREYFTVLDLPHPTQGGL